MILLESLVPTWVAGVAMLVDRSGGTVDFGVPAKALLTLDIKTYAPTDCPLCKQGLPLVKRGSRKTPASSAADINFRVDISPLL